MNKKLLKHIEEKLIEKKSVILNALEKKELDKFTNRESNNITGDIVDKANSVYERQVYSKLGEKEIETLTKINEALKRIEEGVYGKCVVCRKDIEEKRLLAIPEAKKCIVCKSAEEKKKVV